MTNTLDYMIEVMTAAKNGEAIETYRGDGTWRPVQEPAWDWYNNTYRVKKNAPPTQKELCCTNVMQLLRRGMVWIYKDGEFTGIDRVKLNDNLIFVTRPFNSWYTPQDLLDQGFYWADTESYIHSFAL